jgi:hypothetical protein
MNREIIENIGYGNTRHDPFTGEMLIDGQMAPLKADRNPGDLNATEFKLPPTQDVFIGEIGRFE